MSARYFYNDYRAEKNESRCWTVIVINGEMVTHKHCFTEAEAKEFKEANDG